MSKKVHAFTLVELMVVIVIIGVLSSLAIPRLVSMASKARLAEFKPQLKAIHVLQEAYSNEKGAFASASGWQANNGDLGFLHPTSSRFEYSIPAAAVGGVQEGKEQGLAQLRNDVTLKLSTAIVDHASGVLACIDELGLMYGTSSAVVKDSKVSGGLNPCN